MGVVDSNVMHTNHFAIVTAFEIKIAGVNNEILVLTVLVGYCSFLLVLCLLYIYHSPTAVLTWVLMERIV